MPAVLPEFGFHDEPEEARWLIDSMPQIAEETCKAVCDYFGMAYVAPETEPAETPEPPVEDTPLYRCRWAPSASAATRRSTAKR